MFKVHHPVHDGHKDGCLGNAVGELCQDGGNAGSQGGVHEGCPFTVEHLKQNNRHRRQDCSSELCANGVSEMPSVQAGHAATIAQKPISPRLELGSSILAYDSNKAVLPVNKSVMQASAQTELNKGLINSPLSPC